MAAEATYWVSKVATNHRIRISKKLENGFCQMHRYVDRM
jgi:hypothetical protein